MSSSLPLDQSFETVWRRWNCGLVGLGSIRRRAAECHLVGFLFLGRASRHRTTRRHTSRHRSKSSCHDHGNFLLGIHLRIQIHLQRHTFLVRDACRRPKSHLICNETMPRDRKIRVTLESHKS